MANHDRPTGGQAFPVPAGSSVGAEIWMPTEGMTLRDYFAAAALAIAQGLAAETIAKHAYEIADAMLKRRDEP